MQSELDSFVAVVEPAIMLCLDKSAANNAPIGNILLFLVFLALGIVAILSS